MVEIYFAINSYIIKRFCCISDIIGSHYGSLVDGLSTSVLEVDGKQLLKVIAWYDNEMGYSTQMVRTAKYLYSSIKK